VPQPDEAPVAKVTGGTAREVTGPTVHTRVPADLYGRNRPDRFLRNLTALGDAYATVLDRIRQRRPTVTLHGTATTPATAPAWRTMVVVGRTKECADVVSLRLARPEVQQRPGTPPPPGDWPPPGALPSLGRQADEPLPRWQPGAHLRVRLPSGLIRHYSLCGDPADPATYLIAVRRLDDGGGGSAEIHDRLSEGDTVGVLGPRNGFPFAAEPVVLFIAGGIGITPLLPMVRRAAALRLDWRLIYCGRSLDTMPFADEVAAIDPARASVRTGRPDCAELVASAPRRAAVYCCGPPRMIDGVRAAAAPATAARLFRAFRFERFTAAPVVGGHAFQVELKRSGKILDIPADRSVLDVLRGQDPAIAYSCRQGFCGTCVQHVLRGEVEHRDRRLTDTERGGGDMLVCVSRAAEGERLVLDL
jgi:ferredoxin-NADP reductase